MSFDDFESRRRIFKTVKRWLVMPKNLFSSWDSRLNIANMPGFAEVSTDILYTIICQGFHMDQAAASLF